MGKNIMIYYDCGCRYSINEDRKVESISLCKGHYSSFHLRELVRETEYQVAKNNLSKKKKNEK